ncbi:MAG: hypothetical protein JNG90_09265, partial [Planctomycetaceae bacterium]|nr:hypothetical protein [Planctomycetaceae bacterium]
RHHFNQSVLLELRRTVAPSVVEDALQNVLRQHDSLRVAYHHDPATGWSQQGMPYRRCELLQIVDLSQTPDQTCAVEIERVGSTSQASLDLEAGRLLAAVFFDLGPERPARLLIAIHHLAIDAVSWRILLEDLGAAIEALSRGAPPRLAPKTTSFATWSRRLCTLADQPEVRAEVAKWSNAATAVALANPEANLVVDEAACEASFSTDDTTRWLRDANAAYRTRPHELLIAALVQVLNSHQGVDAQLIELEGHGREELFEDVDLSRTVGWFTTLSPRRLSLGPNASAADAIRSIKEQLRAIPRNGLGFGLLRWLTSDAEVRAALATVQRGEISFNYLGQFDQWLPADAPFALLDEPAGATRSPRGQRPHAWEIIAYVRAGRLTVSWRYSRRLHSPELIERLAAAHLETLRALVEHCLDPQAGGATPSDFPRAGLDQPGLDELAAALTRQAPQAPSSSQPLGRIADVLPLAPLQELMLPQALARRGTGELVEQFQCTLRGTLDPDHLRSAAQQAIERHALLRASFIWSEIRHPKILVHQHSELAWSEEDWRSAPPGEQAARLSAWLEHDRREGFDLTRAPLVRFCLLRIGDGEWRFVWTCHHLVADGWSAALVLKDVFTGYGRMPTGQEIEPRPTGQFADYLSWLAARTPSEAAAYWREHLANAQPTPSLPSLDSRDVVGESPREHVEFLSPPVVARLTELAKRERVSLATVLQAAWGMLLARFTGVDDVVFGVAVAGRPSHVPGVEEIVGPLMNNVPLRVSIDWSESLGEHLRGVQAQRVGAELHEHVTLAEVTRAANWPAAQRLFETLLVVENYPWSNSPGAEVAGLQIEEIRGTTSSSYPLTLIAIPGEQLELRLQFDPQRLGSDDTRRILDHFATMLAAMGAGECHALQDLRILSRREREVLVRAASNMPERVLDRWGTCAPVGVAGEIWTTTAMPLRDAAGTADHETRPDPLALESDVQLYPTGYRGRWLPSGAVEWLGPVSASVQIGHYRTDPRELTSILALHPLVDDCAIIARSSATGDDELVAYVVANPAAATLLDSAQSGLLVDRLRGFLASRVPEALVPRMWRTVPTLGRTSTGAIVLEQLPPVFRPRGQAPHPYRAPRDLLEERLARVWSEVLGVEPIGLDDDFSDLGGHSSLAVALLARVENEFGRELSLAALLEQPTIAYLAELLKRDPRSSAASPLVPIRAQGSRPPLFCIHPAGGTVMCYRELARRLDDEVPVYGLQAQGIDDDRAPLEAITELAASYLNAIRSVQPEGPYQLCGWSTGGIIAFEIARQLAASGASVGLLALVDAAIPRAGESFGEADLAALLSMLFPGEDFAHLRDKSPDEQLREFSERAQRAGLLVAESASRQANRIYQVFQANLRGVAEYRPGPLQGCSLTILRAGQHATPMHADPWLGWQPWAEGGIEVLEVDASHLDILEAPAVEQVAKILGPRLAAAL